MLPRLYVTLVSACSGGRVPTLRGEQRDEEEGEWEERTSVSLVLPFLYAIHALPAQGRDARAERRKEKTSVPLVLPACQPFSMAVASPSDHVIT